MGLSSTHTFSILEVSQRTFNEIAARVREAGYEEIIKDGLIDMHGIGLQVEEQPRNALVVNAEIDDLKS